MSDTARAPASSPAPSGRFVLRLDSDLHARLRDEAQRAGLSLNAYCARKLALPASAVTPAAVTVLQHVSRVAGDALLALILHGSWARDRQADASDVDVAIVLAPDADVTRALYSRWEADPPHWEGRPLDPHFLRLPDPGAAATGLWAELAVHGITLYDRDLGTSRWLAEVRARIAEGRLERRMAHGQPYWLDQGQDAQP